jgi:hypothetical protein
MSERTRRIMNKFDTNVARAFAVSQGKLREAQDELNQSLTMIHQELSDELSFEALSSQGQADLIYKNMDRTLRQARARRDQTILKSRRNRITLNSRITIQLAKERFKRVELFQHLRDDYGQDYEQLHLQSGVDPSYDPDVYWP